MVVKIQLFGVLRKFGCDGVVTLDLEEPCTARELKSLIKLKLSADFSGEFQGVLVDRAALANESRVLVEDEQVGLQCKFALLPPACGG